MIRKLGTIALTGDEENRKLLKKTRERFKNTSNYFIGMIIFTGAVVRTNNGKQDTKILTSHNLTPVQLLESIEWDLQDLNSYVTFKAILTSDKFEIELSDAVEWWTPSLNHRILKMARKSLKYALERLERFKEEVEK